MCSQVVISAHQTLPMDLGQPGLVGVDEVGRGPLAGPVVAAAVMLDAQTAYQGLIDSKQLSHKKRVKWRDWIQLNTQDWAVAFVEPQEIDEINILQASLLAMQRAIEQLQSCHIKHVLVDGRHCPKIDYPKTAIIQGDQRVAAISAASILAKVARDDYMVTIDEHYPQYQFAKNKGYPTAVHRQALKQYGPCAIHRASFAPVQKWFAL